MESFIDRLMRAIGNDNPHSFSIKCGFRDSVFRSYMGGALPRLDKLVTIARTAGVNIEWLATGEGPIRPGEEERKETDAPCQPDRRVIPYGRRKADIPMSNQLRRAVEGLIYLEEKDADGFTLISGKIIEREEKARDNEEVKKISNSDA